MDITLNQKSIAETAISEGMNSLASLAEVVEAPESGSWDLTKEKVEERL
jgi:hypothetical protein